MTQEVLHIDNLRVSFRIRDDYYAAVNGVSLEVHPYEVLAIVGESGCGKSALAQAVTGLHDPGRTKLEGSVWFEGTDLLSLQASELNQIRGKKIGLVYQDPLSALNPLMTAGKQIEESLDYHTSLSAEEKRQRTLRLLERVGIANAEQIYGSYPHELSGGMRQRVMIATAMACDPVLLIADEPTTALDVTTQAQIMALLKTLQQQTNAGIVLITHNLGVVAELADRVAVMYMGEIVELTDVYTLFARPLHPYTRSLVHSIPSLQAPDERLHVIEGIVPPLHKWPAAGCRFQPRIGWIPAEDHEAAPALREVEPGHWVRCTCYRHFYIPRPHEGDMHDGFA
ncbi:ABC transporter ATP-binding protein [Paenibacillus thalictri]|uniref:ABC transporter ATP-binding protein n=1 Tax=Paenibacillus thalictri TaxID=2527873 RepID=A0A4Q9DRD6_9BACL|nr:ABC transporter ATP-binding protein [Paenibacillus thalictri]TBL77319.1 ABC transporter ATP-binding protein [Paenibacillus thalictri]